MVDELPADRFALLAISVDAELATVTEFLEDEPMPWSNWHAGIVSDLTQTLAVQSFPTYLLADEEGGILANGNGPLPQLRCMAERAVAGDDPHRCSPADWPRAPGARSCRSPPRRPSRRATRSPAGGSAMQRGRYTPGSKSTRSPDAGPTARRWRSTSPLSAACPGRCGRSSCRPDCTGSRGTSGRRSSWRGSTACAPAASGSRRGPPSSWCTPSIRTGSRGGDAATSTTSISTATSSTPASPTLARRPSTTACTGC